jgi:hypothetical protein
MPACARMAATYRGLFQVRLSYLQTEGAMMQSVKGKHQRFVGSSPRAFGLAALVLLLLLAWALHSSTLAEGPASVSGTVITNTGLPAEGAIVRQKATANYTTASTDGSFVLSGLVEGQAVLVTAWLDGYYIQWQSVTPSAQGVTLILSPYPTSDNPNYVWYSATAAEQSLGCMHCMVAFPGWQAGAHGQASSNSRFFSMYNGVDLAVTKPVDPGFKLDFPDDPGNCANCHAPGAVTRPDGSSSGDMNDLRPGVEQEGIFCEFCHKIANVQLDPATGLPYPEAPGVQSYRLVRTYPGFVLFLGPLDDVTRRVSYLPLEKKSQFCAPCHQFSFFDTPIYQSFAEWLDSPYPAQGIECQTCHMPPESVPYFVYPEKGGLIRDPSTLASHLDLGVKDADFMQRSVSMSVQASAAEDDIEATVVISNVFAGHHVPTDYPGRNMILVIEAVDATGGVLQQLGGPVVPEWGGGGLAGNDYAGQPGKGYAKLLRDLATNEWPVVSYWKPTSIQEDNRIAAGTSDTSTYRFALPTSANLGVVRITATLWLRRLYIDQARAKGWDTPDLLMAESTSFVRLPGSQWRTYLPLVTRW